MQSSVARLVHCALSFSVVSLVIFLPASVASQEARPSAEISERQAELNEEGVRAVIRGDYEKGIAVLSESLAYGEANVTYLNLGRAYQKLGKCREAKNALEKAKTAPAVADPPPEIIDKKADQYLEELEKNCDFDKKAPVADKPDEDQAATDEDDSQASADDSGEDDDTEESSAESLDAPSSGTGGESDGGSSVWGWTMLGTGVAIAGAGIIPHVMAANERAPVLEAQSDGNVIAYDDRDAARREDKANMLNTVGLGMNIGGAVLAGVGTYLIISSGGESKPDKSRDAPKILLRASPTGGRAAIRIRF